MATATERQALWQQLSDAQAAVEHAIAAGDARARDEAVLVFEQARARLEQAFEQSPLPVDARAALAAPKNLTGHVYPYPDYAETQVQAGGLFPLPFVGVCLSGGGSRSAAASMGGLRALRYLGLLDRVTFISTVSGGGWAGVPYTYCPDVIDDDTLLGPVVTDPSLLTWDYHGNPAYALNVLSPQAIGSLCTRVGITEILEQVVDLYSQGVPVPSLWNRAIGKLVLEPFGLGDRLAGGTPSMYFTYTAWWRDNVVLDPNRGLRANEFYTVQMGAGRTHRPYLITNSTFFYPPAADSSRAVRGRSKLATVVANPYPFENTPMVSGMPPSFAGSGEGGRDLGGGFIDPFVFGCDAPTAPPSNRTFTTPTPPSRYALSDIAGTSSSAYVDVLIAQYSTWYPWIEDLDPTYSYWPVLNAGTPKNSAVPYLFGDGGIMENTGIMALLRRHVPNVLAFINGNQKLEIDKFGVIVVDDMLPPLFGYLPYQASDDRNKNGYRPLSEDPTSLFRYNQVFASSAFQPLINNLWQAASAGASAIYKQSGLTVLKNERFGVEGGDAVNVLWIYNNPVPNWRSALQFSVRLEMDLDFLRFGNFPNYDTITQLNLDARQVNLLAHLTCWNVFTNRTLVATMFGS